MRVFNKILGAYNASSTKERRYAIRIDVADGVVLWVVSHPDVVPGTGTVLDGLVNSVSNVSQRLYPLDGRAEIGSLSFDAVDTNQGLSDGLRTQLLTEQRGALGKRVRFYLGDRRAPFSAYELVTTQILVSCKVSRGGTSYAFSCRDVQREERVDALDPLETRLAANISDTDTTIPVIDATLFEGLDHGASFSDAPDTEGVIYFEIDDEIIRTLAEDATATTYTNCVRGVLGTRAAAHTTDEAATTSPDKGKKVREIVYLEMPAPKLAYALQTGILIGQAGTMPDGWNAGMGADSVKLTDYTGIGLDVYAPDDDTAGVSLRFVDPGKQDVKRFVEQEILRPLGLFQPVLADGQLGMRRLRRIVQGAAAVVTVDDSLLLAAPDLEFAGDDIANELDVKWNTVGDDLTRNVIVRDATSIALWGLRKRKVIEARGLHGSRQSKDVVVGILQQQFDRTSGPPIRSSVRLHGSQAGIEPGDIVRILTSHARDWTGQSISLDRPFEVQGVQIDWQKNTVTLAVEASSQSAAPLQPLTDDETIPDAWFVASGTNIAGLTGVTDEGDHYEIGADLTLTGNASLRNTGAIYYASKDVTVAAGVTLSYEQNVQLRIRGVLTINGDLDGSGEGLAGVSDTISTIIPFFPKQNTPVDITFQSGNAGGFGATQAHGGIIERLRQENEGSGFHGFIQSVPAPVTVGAYDVLPLFNLRVEGGQVVGLPDDLRGTGGGPGGLRYFSDTRPAPNEVEFNRGGTGGAGGAGLALITRGIALGASGRITSSGDDGALGAYDAGDRFPAHAGAGAGGAPGGILMVIDGRLNPAPGSVGGLVVAEYGASPLPSGDFTPLPTRLIDPSTKIFYGQTVPEDRFTLDLSSSSGVDATFAATRVQFMPPSAVAVPDVSDEDIAAAESISLEIAEAYTAVADGAVTRLTATVTEVDTSPAYSHAVIYYREASNTNWFAIGAAEPTFTFDFPADNASYVFAALPILTNNTPAPFAGRSNEVSVTVTAGSLSITWSDVQGSGRPQDFADVTGDTLLGGLLPNWSLSIADSSGLPAGIQPVQGIADRSQLSFIDSFNLGMRILSAPDLTVAYGWPAIPIDDRAVYTVSIRHRSETTSTEGYYLRLGEIAGPLPDGETHVTSSNRTSFVDLLWNGPAPGTAYITSTYTYTPTPGTDFASFCVYNWKEYTSWVDVKWVSISTRASAALGADVTGDNESLNVSIRPVVGITWVLVDGNVVPSQTTVDRDVEFTRNGIVASRTVRCTRDGSNNLTWSSVSSSGETTTFSAAGSGTKSCSCTVGHAASGEKTHLIGLYIDPSVGTPSK